MSAVDHSDLSTQPSGTVATSRSSGSDVAPGPALDDDTLDQAGGGGGTTPHKPIFGGGGFSGGGSSGSF